MRPSRFFDAYGDKAEFEERLDAANPPTAQELRDLFFLSTDLELFKLCFSLTFSGEIVPANSDVLCLATSRVSLCEQVTETDASDTFGF